MPCFRARWPAAWMAGPSAIGSENGMPISIRSAPAAGRPANSLAEVAGSGSPAVKYVTRPARRPPPPPPPPPPGGARGGGGGGGMPDWVQAPTSPSPSPERRVPSLSALKGGEGQHRTPLLQQSQPDPEMVGDGEDVFVAAAAHVHD